jgi:molybdopterin converting factor subunit 1
MNTIKTLFFATLRDRTGVKSVEIQIPEQTTVATFKLMLVQKFPSLNGLLDHTLVAVNQEYVFDETVLPANAEIALFPPVSGG